MTLHLWLLRSANPQPGIALYSFCCSCYCPIINAKVSKHVVCQPHVAPVCLSYIASLMCNSVNLDQHLLSSSTFLCCSPAVSSPANPQPHPLWCQAWAKLAGALQVAGCCLNRCWPSQDCLQSPHWLTSSCEQHVQDLFCINLLVILLASAIRLFSCMLKLTAAVGLSNDKFMHGGSSSKILASPTPSGT